jgi:hypothetical protein
MAGWVIGVAVRSAAGGVIIWGLAFLVFQVLGFLCGIHANDTDGEMAAPAGWQLVGAACGSWWFYCCGARIQIGTQLEVKRV